MIFLTVKYFPYILDWKSALTLASATSNQPYIIAALTSDFAQAQDFYDACGYEGAAINKEDIVLLVKSGSRIVGVGRLCREHGVLTLRGMQIHTDFRQQGLGSRLLAALVQHMPHEPCYCLPYDHLGAFYAQGGFSVVQQAQLPDFLAQRLAEYLDFGRKVMAMRRMP